MASNLHQFAHVEEATKLSVGFYGVTYQIGFRENFDVDVNAVIQDICMLEKRAKGDDAEEAIREIKEAALRTTHMFVGSALSSRFYF